MQSHCDSILCGNCLHFLSALPEKCVDLVFADPPYNLQLEGELWRPNQTKVDPADDHWDRFASFEEYDAFTREWLSACRRVMKDTATLWVIGTYHNIYRIGAILQDLGFWFLNDVVWVKRNPTPQMKGVRLCNAHETLLWVKKSKEQKAYTFHYREAKAGNEDLQMRSDWHFPICQGEERVKVHGQKAHSTQKPEALLHRILSLCTNPGDLVLDPFCGSGTTAAVAKRLRRHFLTIDRDPEYVRVARERVAAVTSALAGEDEDLLIGTPKPRVPFRELVETGRLPAGTELFIPKSNIRARVNSDGTLSLNGWKGSIHKIGALALGLHACNGWTTWRFMDPATGEDRAIDDLRPGFNAAADR